MKIDRPIVAKTTTRCGLSSAGLMMRRWTRPPNRNIAGTTIKAAMYGLSPASGDSAQAPYMREHQKFAVREVDDAQHAEDQRQADAHQRIDAADEDAGKDELPERGHRDVSAEREDARRAAAA